jgi:hypothetical protein
MAAAELVRERLSFSPSTGYNPTPQRDNNVVIWGCCEKDVLNLLLFALKGVAISFSAYEGC